MIDKTKPAKKGDRFNCIDPNHFVVLGYKYTTLGWFSDLIFVFIAPRVT